MEKVDSIACEYYVGITNRVKNRIDQYMHAIRDFLLYGINWNYHSDDNIADAMIDETLFYWHIAIPGTTCDACD